MSIADGPRLLYHVKQLIIIKIKTVAVDGLVPVVTRTSATTMLSADQLRSNDIKPVRIKGAPFID